LVGRIVALGSVLGRGGLVAGGGRVGLVLRSRSRRANRRWGRGGVGRGVMVAITLSEEIVLSTIGETILTESKRQKSTHHCRR